MNEQQFLQDFEKKVCSSENTFYSNISVVFYRDVAFGLVFLKYVSDNIAEVLSDEWSK